MHGHDQRVLFFNVQSNIFPFRIKKNKVNHYMVNSYEKYKVKLKSAMFNLTYDKWNKSDFEINGIRTHFIIVVFDRVTWLLNEINDVCHTILRPFGHIKISTYE